MKIATVGVTSSNLKETVKFYTTLGFTFPDYEPDEQHLEPLTPDGSARLMIDSKELITNILGKVPQTANHSSFAIEFSSPEEVNLVAKKIAEQNYTLVKEPWDAFWGQRYAIIADPDGYMIDLYAKLD
jgi:catechol 2,3-dioxygenase-like lactoylglutathione lyase family enzyme